MKKSKILRIVLFVIIAVTILQAGFMAYSMFGGMTNEALQEQNTVSEEQPAATVEAVSIDEEETEDIVISDEILDIIREQDPENYETNLTNYKNMLVKLNVHKKFQDELERLLKEEKMLADILIAYEFLNDSYGKLEDVLILINDKEEKESWSAVFKEYNRNNPEFIPQAFESGYLENLMKTSSLTADDIMIADRVSQKVNKPFKDIINERISGASWKRINAEFDVVNGDSFLPHVPVTREQISKYTESGHLTEQQVVEALVIVNKMKRPEAFIIEKVREGMEKEDIYALCYEEKYCQNRN